MNGSYENGRQGKGEESHEKGRRSGSDSQVSGVGLLFVVILTHYGYPEQQAEWWFYIFRGIEGTVIFALLGWHMRASVIAFVAAMLGILEESQTAACGYIAMQDPPSSYAGDLCTEVIGPLPYAVLVASLYVWWRTRDR